MFIRPDQDGVTSIWTSGRRSDSAAPSSGEVRLADVVVDGDLVIEEGAAPDPVDGPPSVLGAYDQALHAAVDIGIARAALEDGAEFVGTRSRPWKEAVLAGVTRADEEPHVVRRFGELTARLYALEALLAHGTAVVDEGLAETELSRDTAARARRCKLPPPRRSHRSTRSKLPVPSSN